jgi:TPR repeat protein
MDISKIDPWVDSAPSNANTMSLRKLRQKMKKKKKKPWAYRQMAFRYQVGGGGLKKSLKKAVDHYKKGIKFGDPRCMNQLGYMYGKGAGVAVNEKLAFEYYQMSAFKGLGSAQHNLGSCYANGTYVEKNNTEAREWFNKAAAQGDEDAIKNLELLDEEEKAEEESQAQIRKEEKKAEEEKRQPQIMQEEPIKSERSRATISPTSTYVNNTKEGEIKDTKDLEIVPWIDDAPKNAKKMTLNKLRQKVKKKKLWAVGELGRRYKFGEGGVELSLEKAIDNYKKGTKLGDPVSMNQLGVRYAAGQGVVKNKKLAFEYYQMAALKGYDIAQSNLGSYYFHGAYVEQSNTKAREWFDRAAAQGQKEAIKCLKVLDENEKAEEENKAAIEEEKVEENESQPQIMQEEKIKSEIPSASASPSSKNIIDNEKIETKDTKDLEIVPWIDDAPTNSMTMTLNKLRHKVKKKKLWAMLEMGRRNEYGEGGVELSLEKAIDCYKKGIKLGDPRCMAQLGIMYEEGEGVAKNEKLAFEHYQMGALKGYDNAQYNLGACYYDGEYVEQSYTKAREWFNRAAAQGNEKAIKELKILDKKEKSEEEERQTQIMQEKEEKKEEKETKEEKATTPTTTVVTKKKHRLYCLNCRRPYTNQTKHMFRRCSMCCGRDAIFCGPLCQELTWPDHREECIRIGIILHNY